MYRSRGRAQGHVEQQQMREGGGNLAQGHALVIVEDSSNGRSHRMGDGMSGPVADGNPRRCK
jgi:hypothetical protein